MNNHSEASADIQQSEITVSIVLKYRSVAHEQIATFTVIQLIIFWEKNKKAIPPLHAPEAQSKGKLDWDENCGYH